MRAFYRRDASGREYGTIMCRNGIEYYAVTGKPVPPRLPHPAPPPKDKP